MEIKGWGKPPEDRLRFAKMNVELAKIKTRLRKIEMMLIRIEGLCEDSSTKLEVKR